LIIKHLNEKPDMNIKYWARVNDKYREIIQVCPDNISKSPDFCHLSEAYKWAYYWQKNYFDKILPYNLDTLYFGYELVEIEG